MSKKNVEWEWKKLGEVCDSINGLWKGKKEPFVKVCVIRNTNFTKDCKLNLDADKLEILDVEKKQYASRKLQYGDLIIEKSGGSEKQPVGRAILFEETKGEFSFSNFTSVLRIKDTSKISCHFLHSQLYKLYLDGVTKSMQPATTGIHNLEFDKYKQLDIAIPPLAEQERIVKVLDDAFAKIDKIKTDAETNLQNAKDLFLSQKDSAFETTNVIRLGECGELKNGLNFSPSESGYKLRYLGVGDFKDHFSIDDVSALTEISLNSAPNADYLLKDGDIVFVRSNGNKQLVGRSLLVFPGECETTFGGFCIRFRKTINALDSRYLLHYLKTTSVRKVLQGKDGTNIQNLNQKILNELPIPLPPLSIQKQIVAKLDSLSEKVKQLESNYKQVIADCDELKKSILKKAFEGQL